MRRVTTGELMRLAVPSIAFAVLTNAYRAVDQYFIQHVSTEAQAAIGSAIFPLIFFYSAFALIAGGAAPLLARATGAGDPEERRRVLGAALAGGLVLTVVCGLVGGLGAHLIARALGLTGATAAECARYLQVISLTILPLVLTPLIDQAFIAMGSARVPMLLHGVSLGVNAVLTWFLVVRLDLGVVGAGLASSASRALATAIGLTVLWRKTELRLSDVRIGRQLLRLARIGAPLTAGGMSFALVYFAVLYTSVSPLGPQYNAALGIGFSALEGFTWPMSYGLSLAVGSFVGRALGEGDTGRAWSVLRTAAPLGLGIGVGATAAFWFGGAWLTGLFAADPSVHAAATQYATILAFSQFAVAVEALTDGVLHGAGDTRTSFWLTTPMNVARIPVCWVLAFPLGMGAAGVWWGINICSWVKPVLKGVAVFRGGWAELEL